MGFLSFLETQKTCGRTAAGMGGGKNQQFCFGHCEVRNEMMIRNKIAKLGRQLAT